MEAFVISHNGQPWLVCNPLQCAPGLRESLILIPTSFYSSVVFVPWIVLPMCITLDLTALKLMLHFSSRSHGLFSFCCNFSVSLSFLIIVQNLVSSANLIMLVRATFTVINVNEYQKQALSKPCPSTVSCGTPEPT